MTEIDRRKAILLALSAPLAPYAIGAAGEQTQERDRVRATRHSHGHAVSCTHQSPFADVTKHLFAHGMMVMQVSAFSH